MEKTTTAMMSVPELARLVGLTESRIRQLCRESRIKTIRLGRDWIIPVDGNREIIEKMMRGHK